MLIWGVFIDKMQLVHNSYEGSTKKPEKTNESEHQKDRFIKTKEKKNEGWVGGKRKKKGDEKERKREDR
jgi:hypothetical protein